MIKRLVPFILTFFLSLTFLAQTQRGKATFYSKKATGSRTANGERLHHDSMTCAHRSYPFGTFLRVTNTMNGKEVVVRVNDRGPFVRGRIIDLSWGAAKAIGMLATGVAPVVVEELDETEIPYRSTRSDEIPRLELDLADIAPIGITPIWQQEVYIDHKKVRHAMHRTTRASSKKLKTASTDEKR